MNPELIDYTLYAAAAIALAAALWPRRKGLPMNCEQGKTASPCKSWKKTGEMQQAEAQDDDFGYAKLMLKAAAINERIQAMHYINRMEAARQNVIWMDNPQATMNWDELASQPTSKSKIPNPKS